MDRLNTVIGRLSGWLVLLMVLVGGFNVIGRYLGNALGQNLSSNALIETQWYLFSLVFLLGAAYTLKENAHVRMDVLYSTWPPRRKALADFVATLVFLLPFSGFALWFTWTPVLNSWRIREGSPDPGGLPRYPIKSFILVMFILLIAQGISGAIQSWAIYRGISPPTTAESDSTLTQEATGEDNDNA
ncbi:TRAP transporter small permease subunit [Phormidium yuhuli]|uniref:TRAP transporter small permease subunit n=1 Tax=Phormidium yuhuli TaxID=2974039 RepID=UPI0035A9944F